MAFELTRTVPLIEIGGSARDTADGKDMDITVELRFDSGSSFRNFFLNIEETKQLIQGLTEVHDALQSKRDAWLGLSEEARAAVLADRARLWDDLLSFH